MSRAPAAALRQSPGAPLAVALAVAGALSAVGLAVPLPASAHGLVQRGNLPDPGMAVRVGGHGGAGGVLPGSGGRSAAFAPALVPIAMAYVAAHYLTFLLLEGQAIGYLASDPLGRGWNLFGTRTAGIDFSLISQTSAWYAQVAFIVLGHVAGLALAHERALTLFGAAREAVRSQYWMLAVMVGFTTLALWLLAQTAA